MGRPVACDGPSCNTWYRTKESYESDGTVTVKWNGVPRSRPKKLYFCSWDCVLAFGMANTMRTEHV